MILEARELTKSYRDLVAVKAVSLSLRGGGCTGIVGRNGAGKTTLLEMLQGVRKPDSGSVSVFGQRRTLPDKSILDKIGVAAQFFALPPLLTVRELFRLYASFYSNPMEPDGLMTRMGLEEKASTTFGRLSGGQKKRVSVGLALIGNPSLLFLDEPSGELDPHARRSLWDLIKEQSGESRAVLLATHQMEEVAALCDEVIVLDRGEIKDSGSPDCLINKHCPQYRLNFEANASFNLGEIGIPGLKCKMSPNRPAMMVELVVPDFESAYAAVDRIRRVGGAAITSFGVQRMTLDDVFIKLTGKELKESP